MTKRIALALVFSLSSTTFFGCQKQTSLEPQAQTIAKTRTKSAVNLAESLTKNAHFRASVAAFHEAGEVLGAPMVNMDKDQLASLQQRVAALPTDAEMQDVTKLVAFSVEDYNAKMRLFQSEWASVKQSFPELSELSEEEFKKVVGDAFVLMNAGGRDCDADYGDCTRVHFSNAAYEFHNGNIEKGIALAVVGNIICAVNRGVCRLSN